MYPPQQTDIIAWGPGCLNVLVRLPGSKFAMLLRGDVFMVKPVSKPAGWGNFIILSKCSL